MSKKKGIEQIQIYFKSKWLRCTLTTQKTRATFYTKYNFHKLPAKLKDRGATEDKNSITYKITCNNYRAVYVFKRFLKSWSDEHKRSVKSDDIEKNEIAKCHREEHHNFNWGQKEVVDRRIRLIPRKFKETIHSFKNHNYIYKISYILPEVWLPNLR